MQKNASKNIIPSKSYKFLKIWVAIKLRTIFNRVQKVLSFDIIHARNLKFGMYLPCYV